MNYIQNLSGEGRLVSCMNESFYVRQLMHHFYGDKGRFGTSQFKYLVDSVHAFQSNIRAFMSEYNIEKRRGSRAHTQKRLLLVLGKLCVAIEKILLQIASLAEEQTKTYREMRDLKKLVGPLKRPDLSLLSKNAQSRYKRESYADWSLVEWTLYWLTNSLFVMLPESCFKFVARTFEVIAHIDGVRREEARHSDYVVVFGRPQDEKAWNWSR